VVELAGAIEDGREAAARLAVAGDHSARDRGQLRDLVAAGAEARRPIAAGTESRKRAELILLAIA
jgi:hypothetical protein